MQPLWTCPACGRRFARRNVSHACGRHTVEEHLDGKAPAVVGAYGRLTEEIRRCGPVTVLPQRAGIAFQSRTIFAEALLRRRWLDVRLVLRRPRRSPRIRSVTTASPGQYEHMLRIRDAGEIDGQMAGWIAEAYLAGLGRRGRAGAPPPIRAERLDLVAMPPEFMVSMLRGDHETAEAAIGLRLPDEWKSEDWSWFRYRLGQLAEDPSCIAWLARIYVRRGRWPAIVGNGGFHGPPNKRGAAELGYQVVLDRRRQGFAQEAAEALMEWAGREHGVERFIASVGPWNGPSLGLARKLGFVQVGSQWDEVDGEELVFELERARPGGPARSGR
jgi:ribosomal-protein-alanine N-acetyltransferase